MNKWKPAIAGLGLAFFSSAAIGGATQPFPVDVDFNGNDCVRRHGHSPLFD